MFVRLVTRETGDAERKNAARRDRAASREKPVWRA
jgi:hypothetical protein